jgi:uncharacterized protein YecE (DUF72 family)
VFDTVEINNSFYRLPDSDTFRSWRAQAPDDFLYSVKCSRYLTHLKKLIDPEDPLKRFFKNARELGSRLGPVLYQLPPNFGLNLERFERFLRAIRRVAPNRRPYHHLKHVIEFREPSWYDDRVFALMKQFGIALCLHDLPGSASDRSVVGPCVYVRFHFGTSRYGGRYDSRRLDAWADWLVQQHLAGLDVFAYFNNDTGGHAPRDAVRLRERIRRRVNAAGS